MTRSGLAELLEREDLLYAELAHVRWLLGLPPFRPPAGHPLASRAASLVPAAVAPPGAVLLVGEHRGAGGLFWCCPSDPPERLIPFRGEAREQVQLARRIVPRALPALVEPAALETEPMGARRAVLGSTDPGALDGPSFGLAISLAYASRLLDEALPAEQIALARVDDEGRCLAVGHLEAKIEVVAQWALGGRKILVSESQQAEAEHVVSDLGAELEVVGVQDLSAALRHVFGDVERLLQERWAKEPQRARRAVRALLSLARDGCHHLLDWSAVASAAHGLAEQLEGEDRWMAELAEHIANRHRDAPTPLTLHEEWLSAQPRPFRLKLWAHVVQSAADGVDAWRPLLEMAERELARPGERHAEDLELLGALGRAHASWYDYERASAMLEEAITGWLRIERADDASYAVAELARVVGATGDAREADDVMATAVWPTLMDPRTGEVARAFVSAATARMLVQVGRVDHALEWLADEAAAWGRAPAHTRAARLRWMAEAFDELGRSEEADQARAVLSAEHAVGDGGVVAVLGRLDEAARRDHRLEEVFMAVGDHPLLGRELVRLHERWPGSEVSGVVERLRRHARY